MNATNDRIKGAMNTALGKIKRMVGHVTNDKKLQGAGDTQIERGKLLKRAGISEDNIQKGATIDGRSINNAGNREPYITE